MVAFEDSALGEAWARALAKHAGIVARTPRPSFLAAVAIDGADVLQTPCPSHHVRISAGTPPARHSRRVTRSSPRATKDLATLEAKGVRIRRARVANPLHEAV